MRTEALPLQFRQTIPRGRRFFSILDVIQDNRLHTVCEEAKCPNRTDCYAKGTLTFQILGELCTRRCGFCAERTGRPQGVDRSDPQRILRSVLQLNLSHVVLTAPARDDLEDGGASQFRESVTLLKENVPHVTVEVLVSDLNGDKNSIHRIIESRPDIYNHNVETVRRLTPTVRAKATYDRSLEVLSFVSNFRNVIKVKSGLMVGLGEAIDEIFETLSDLKSTGVQFLSLGQYLSPSRHHLSIKKYYSLSEFELLKNFAHSLGFEKVLSGPLVRSSYHADEYVNQ